jgi:gas vesicle protein
VQSLCWQSISWSLVAVLLANIAGVEKNLQVNEQGNRHPCLQDVLKTGNGFISAKISHEGDYEMNNENHEYRYLANNILGVLAGILIGGLAGAVTMLLLAPRSGKDTRRQIREKGIELRDRTAEMMEDTMTQVRTNTNKLTMGVKDYSKEVAVEQLDNVSEAAQAGKKAIQNS